MKNFFGPESAKRWPRQHRLHVYVLPDPQVVAWMTPYRQYLEGLGLPGLPLQPDPWVHMTIVGTGLFLDEVSDTELADVTDRLRDRIAAQRRFALQVGPVLPGKGGVTLDAVPADPQPAGAEPDAAYRQLYRSARSVFADVFGPHVVPAADKPGRPHLSLAYSRDNIDFDPYVGGLYSVRVPRMLMPVDNVVLVAVTRNAEQGIYQWETPLETIALG